MVSVSISAAVEKFLTYCRPDVSASTFVLYNRYLRRLAKAHGAVELHDVTPAFVRAWGKTYHAVQAVQRLMSWAKREALLIPLNPLEGMKKLPRGRRLRTLSPVETVKMLRHSSREFRALLLAMNESIARPGELRRASWPDVRVKGLQPFAVEDLREGRAFIFLDRFKSQDQLKDVYAVRVIPISRRLGRLLARLWLLTDDQAGPVFRNRRGRRWTHNAVICRLRRLRVRAGIAVDHRGENVTAYSLRHTSATAAVCAGLDLATLAALMGHSDVRMTMRYVHLAPSHLAKALGRVNDAKLTERRESERLRRCPNGRDV